MEQRLTVLGVKCFNDQIEGKQYNFTKVVLQLPVSRNSTTQKGFNAVEAMYGDSKNFDTLKDLPFPCVCIVDAEMTTKGVDVFSVRPETAAKAPVKAVG